MPRRHTTLPRGIHPSACGGTLRNRARGRGKRSLSFKHSMHLVLRSTLARGAWSFVRGNNRFTVENIITKHCLKTGVEMLGIGNAGNHLHLRVNITSRTQYFKFIRSITGEIALKIKRIPNPASTLGRNFWDKRPFSSIVSGARYVARLKDYIEINHLEGNGVPRAFARLVVNKWSDTRAHGQFLLSQMHAQAPP